MVTRCVRRDRGTRAARDARARCGRRARTLVAALACAAALAATRAEASDPPRWRECASTIMNEAGASMRGITRQTGRGTSLWYNEASSLRVRDGYEAIITVYHHETLNRGQYGAGPGTYKDFTHKDVCETMVYKSTYDGETKNAYGVNFYANERRLVE